MGLDTGLNSLSPLDGRYAKQTRVLRAYFSEAAYIRYRIRVEITYLHALIKFLDKSDFKLDWQEVTGETQLNRVKEIEARIHHDVKAIEMMLGEELIQRGLIEIVPWVHWGLTSEDTNNLAYGLMEKEASEAVVLPEIKRLLGFLIEKADTWVGVVMPARTHGQLAVPTTVGKELMVIVSRTAYLYEKIEGCQFGGKLNGAVGNFNAQVLLYPDKDWLEFSREFIVSLGLDPTLVTTQIESGTKLNYWLSLIWQTNLIWLDFTRDAWLYIALDYWQQKVKEEEVGSSTMPQKVNPIDFENAEGNLEIANGLINKIMERLSQSRLQRDLSDSTVKRNIGVALGHTLIAMKSLMRGLNKVEPNREKLQQELELHPEMLSESLQLKLRAEGDKEAYEDIKKLIRGKGKSWERVIKQYPELSKWRVEKYVGLAEKITRLEIRRIRSLCNI
jgi:adenylosuccinate lyase